MSSFERRHNSDNSFGFTRLAERGGISAASYVDILNNMIVRFGRTLQNVSPDDIPKLNTAVENDNSDEVLQLLGLTDDNASATNHETELGTSEDILGSFFEMAVKDCNTKWVECFLSLIAKKAIQFDIAASMMKENFNDLWLDHRGVLEAMMLNDVLSWDSNFGARVGTCNTISDWIQAARDGTAFEYWRSSDEKGVDELIKNSRGKKVNAIVRIYCFEDSCQIGLDGIIRFLLMHKAPSYLFRTPLIKCVITFKWEKIWKVMAFKHLAIFLVLFVGYQIPFFEAPNDEFFHVPKLFRIALLAFTTNAAFWLPILTLRREYFQLKRCILDGRKIFPANRYRGIRNYFGSRPNQLDLILTVLVLVNLAIYSLYMYGIYSRVGSMLSFLLYAFALLLMWAKGFYLLQAFKKIGIYVVMISRVLQECIPYFVMLFGVTIGFALAMRLFFLFFTLTNEDPYPDQLSVLASKNLSATNETFWTLISAIEYEAGERCMDSFGSLYKSMLTMVYAMVGLFDPEVLLYCGALKGIMIALFVVYLLLQYTVMFNMLIASMSDAFDGVRAKEEELLLMARAMFVNRYAASFSKTEIQPIKGKTGKYLYVLIPEDKQLKESVSLWKGKIPTIKEDVTEIVMEYQNQLCRNLNSMTQHTYEMFKGLGEDIKNDLKSQEERLIESLEERITKSLEERFTRSLEERFRLMEQRIHDKNTSH